MGTACNDTLAPMINRTFIDILNTTVSYEKYIACVEACPGGKLYVNAELKCIDNCSSTDAFVGYYKKSKAFECKETCVFDKSTGTNVAITLTDAIRLQYPQLG